MFTLESGLTCIGLSGKCIITKLKRSVFLGIRGNFDDISDFSLSDALFQIDHKPNKLVINPDRQSVDLFLIKITFLK